MVTLGPLSHWVSSLNLIFCFNLGAGAQTEGEFVGPDPLRPWSPRLGYSRVRGLASADVISRRGFGHAKTIGADRSRGGMGWLAISKSPAAARCALRQDAALR